jgi:hypothetical protein
MSELFADIQEMPSPRLAWKRRYQVQTHKDRVWSAEGVFLCGPVKASLSPHLPQSEDDVLAQLARKAGVPLWMEEEFAAEHESVVAVVEPEPVQLELL